jgi:FemAB-related protein (PEP-CTERM system-associated)
MNTSPAIDIKTSSKPAGEKMTIRPVTSNDQERWDKFVFSTAASASFFHQFSWRSIFHDIFSLEPKYLLAELGGEILGVLPLVYQKSFLFGNALISAPFCVEGGPLAVDAVTRTALDEAAIALARKLNVKSLEFRSRVASREGWAVKRGLYATFARELFADDEKNLLAIPRKQRAVVRKALLGSLSGCVDEDVTDFFRVYSESMRNLGTPMFPISYFKALRKAFGKNCDIIVIRDGSVPVSAVMNFYFKDTVLPYYGGGTAKARYNGANDLLYWEVMRRAAERGFRRFDFGRSKLGTGAFAFKKNWGFEPQGLEYEFWLQSARIIPEKNPTNPVYANLSKVWKKLPLPVANFIGPFLIRGLG